MNIEVLNTPVSELGEGIYLDKELQRLYWVDIIKGYIYQYDILGDRLVKKIKVDNFPSCILSANKNNLIYIDNAGIKKVFFADDSTSTISCHPEHSALDFRANDGSILADGSILYGTMCYSPDEKAGKIYHVDIQGVVKSYNLGIHIPNTFIEIDNGVFLSDSLKKKIYFLNVGNIGDFDDTTLGMWNDFSKYDYTPDGGCLSQKGYLHIALWGGAAIGIFSKSGMLMKYIPLPVLQPTNCVIYNNRFLYVTSAREGMSAEHLIEFPLSGQTIVVDLGSNYEY
ncbi:SMP-30/gluconolactonase/LRE family protein [Vibrio splendidus]